MRDTRYTYNVDLDKLTTSHSLAVLSVPPGATVLDIGTADGSVARPMTTRGCRVWGIELDADLAAKARSVCERVIIGDVETLDLDAALEGRRFDVVLLLDILEHLRDPLATLKRARDFIAPGGRVIVSIPNVTHGAVRVSLMSGTFAYTDTGLLDKTHLRFFDRQAAEALFRDAGLQIVERLRVVRGLTETEIPVDPAELPPQILQMLENDPEARTYQFVLVGVPSLAEHVPDGRSLAERLQRRTEELELQYQRLEAYARSLDGHNHAQAEVVARLTAHNETLDGELDARMKELAQSRLEVRHAQADLALKDAYITELRQTIERVSSETQSELANRMQELSQRQIEARFLVADIAVKEAFIADLRQALYEALGENAGLRAFRNSAGARLITKIVGWSERYPRTQNVLRRTVRRLAGRPSR